MTTADHRTVADAPGGAARIHPTLAEAARVWLKIGILPVLAASAAAGVAAAPLR